MAANDGLHLVATAAGKALTLGELRNLVELANLYCMPDDVIVRGNAVPFKFSDLGNVKGATMRSLAFDKPEGGKS